ncbi:hypothetical protein BDA96_07G084700 [Sorghum bicolor]|uniref:Uncharacterized protein n=2 Tax=Sorghum bicolor TaxID=4558 RepID=A0A921U8V3_SORBI|nr:hypothetical protein BDA96_07G084700 [Sorghum bicolor]KXG24748.1 hypothetical protein SORBI_3007G081000 [Sorghum bicolor]
MLLCLGPTYTSSRFHLLASSLLGLSAPLLLPPLPPRPSAQAGAAAQPSPSHVHVTSTDKPLPSYHAHRTCNGKDAVRGPLSVASRRSKQAPDLRFPPSTSQFPWISVPLPLLELELVVEIL